MKTNIENTAQLHSFFYKSFQFIKNTNTYLYIPEIAYIVFKKTLICLVRLHKSCTNISSVCYEKCQQCVLLYTSEVLHGVELEEKRLC